jgi:hypothetical protein
MKILRQVLTGCGSNYSEPWPFVGLLKYQGGTSIKQDYFGTEAAVRAPGSANDVLQHGISAGECRRDSRSAAPRLPRTCQGLALSMHERTVWGYDPDLIEFWASVVTELKKNKRSPAG